MLYFKRAFSIWLGTAGGVFAIFLGCIFLGECTILIQSETIKKPETSLTPKRDSPAWQVGYPLRSQLQI